MLKNTLIILTVFILISAVQLHGMEYYNQSGYTFRCDVRNNHFKDIRDVRISGFISSASARLEFSSDGYRKSYKTVYLRENQKDYRVSVRMDDATIFCEIMDHNHNSISGSYYSNSQTLYWGDEYGVKFKFPKKGFKKLQRNDLVLRVNHFTPFGARLVLQESGDQWVVECVVKRRDLDRMTNRIDLYAKRDDEEAKITEIQKPATLKEKIRFVENLTSGFDLVPPELGANMLEIMKEEIEKSIIESNDPDTQLKVLGTGSTLLDEFANDIHKKIKAKKEFK